MHAIKSRLTKYSYTPGKVVITTPPGLKFDVAVSEIYVKYSGQAINYTNDLLMIPKHTE